MSGQVNNMFVCGKSGSEGNIEPQHATVTIRGIEIDAAISDLIEFLWNHRIDTMRSCEDLNGWVYIAFRNVCDAVKAGVMVSTAFRLRVVPNDEDGGYAAPSIFIPQECLQYTGVTANDSVCRYAQRALKPALKDLKITNLIKRAYCTDPAIRVAALVASAVVTTEASDVLFAVGDGNIHAQLSGPVFKPRSKSELLRIEDAARNKLAEVRQPYSTAQ